MSKKQMVNMVYDLKKGEKIPLTFDEAAKIMFASSEHPEPLTLLLSRVLEEKYEDLEGRIEIIDPYVPNKHLGEKKTERDIVVKLISENDGNNYSKIIIEVNFLDKKSQSVLNRNMYYFDEVFASGLRQKEKYSKIKSSLLINLNTFFVDNKNQELFDYYYFRNKHGYIYSKSQKILNINIAKCYEKWYNDDVPKFKNEDESDLFYLCASMVTKSMDEFNRCIKLIKVNSNIKEVIKEVSDTMNQDEEIKIRYYNAEEERKRIYESIIDEEKEEAEKIGIQKGIKQGIEIKENEIVTNMYHKNMSIDLIAELTNLSASKVEEIINEITK